MRSFTYSQSGSSKFGAPIGVYKAIFSGLEDRESEQYGPGVEWKFTIAEGEHKGQIVTRTTAPEPTEKNSCGKFLRGILGRVPSEGEAVNLDQVVGKTFQVVIEENSTGRGTRVGQVMALPGSFVPGTSTPGPVNRPAPPAPKSSAHIKDPEPAKYWIQDTDGQGQAHVVEMTDVEIRHLLSKGTIKPENLPVMAHDQQGGWKTAKNFGLQIPF